MIDGGAIREARERNGEAAEGRSEEVEEILAPTEKVGFKNELSLLDREYEAYPDGDELLRPKEGEALRKLANHPLISTPEQMADELQTTVEWVEKALDIHGIEPPDSIEVDVDDSRLTQILGGVPHAMVSPTNPILVGVLYAEVGLSTEEAADVLAEASETNVSGAEVRQTLTDCGLIEGRGSDEIERHRRRNHGEINRPVSGRSRGLTINASDY